MGEPKRRINAEALAIIKHAEAGGGINAKETKGPRKGLYKYRTVYLCPSKVPTVGYGHTRTVKPGDVDVVTITEARADELLTQDLATYEDGVARITEGLGLGNNQFSALVSLAFNIGLEALRTSSVMKFLRMGEWAKAAEAITWWTKGTVNGRKTVLPGLVTRRAAEMALFLTPDEERDRLPDAVGDTPVHETPKTRTSLLKSRTIWTNLTTGVLGTGIAASDIILSGAPGSPSLAGAALVAGALANIWFRRDDWDKNSR